MTRIQSETQTVINEPNCITGNNHQELSNFGKVFSTDNYKAKEKKKNLT